jgi:hypothetical protein
MREGRPSPALIISVIALIFAVGGGYAVAKGGSDKKSDKKIANKVVSKRASGLSVLHAKTADNATNADNAKVATDLSYAKRYNFFVGPSGGSDFLTIGPFTFDLTCTINSGGTDSVMMEIRSSVNHAMFDASPEEDDMVAGTKYDFESTSTTTPNPDIEITSFNSDGGFAPGGSGFSSAGPVLTINAPGHVGQCGASGVFFVS